MYTTILVPVDLTESNTAAVRTAVELARWQDGRVVLLHVIETIDDVPFEEIRDFYAGLEAKAHGLMDSLTEGLDEPGNVERRIVYGRRLRDVLSTCDEIGADLLVLHSHRLVPGDLATGIGTLSHEIAVMAKVPVLLVK